MNRDEAVDTAAAARPPLLVSLRGASVRFGPLAALERIHLALHRGDRLALVGANGSGKTTLLRLLHGLAPADGERTAYPLAPEGRPLRAAMLFQRPFLLNLSVRWNVLVGLWLAGVPAAERHARCHRALERVGLSTLAARRARELSGGQQQRLALARAWALAPDILFLDEPTASLDPGAKREVEQVIGEFAADGVTIVMSTHNLGQAKRLATRVAYLEGGRLLADLPVDRFFDGRELPEQARQFLKGELPWNT
ncbi:MAG: ATP-binding cassette domain-containing protein [Rubrivivax sp.]|nr:ATP-binding cassette domain-containing protein [Rubrivivax sp.]